MTDYAYVDDTTNNSNNNTNNQNNNNNNTNIHKTNYCAYYMSAPIIIVKTYSVHPHILKVIFETATVTLLRQKPLYTTPSEWRWCLESVFRIMPWRHAALKSSWPGGHQRSKRRHGSWYASARGMYALQYGYEYEHTHAFAARIPYIQYRHNVYKQPQSTDKGV